MSEVDDLSRKMLPTNLLQLLGGDWSFIARLLERGIHWFVCCEIRSGFTLLSMQKIGNCKQTRHLNIIVSRPSSMARISFSLITSFDFFHVIHQ